MNGPIYAMSDIHGHRDTLLALLQSRGLASESGDWTGGAASLWMLGDYTDRGPDGVGVIDLLMRLQEQAAAAGGELVAVLGNHEVLLLGAYHFRDGTEAAAKWHRWWKINGGQDHDLDRLRVRQVMWLTFLPALVLRGSWLLAHADSIFYLLYGRSREAANESIKQVLLCDDPAAWTNLGNWFTGRMSFLEKYDDGAEKLDEFLACYGGSRLIHGHTPVGSLTESPHGGVTEAYVYRQGRCVNVDGGLYAGGPGIIYRVPDAGGGG